MFTPITPTLAPQSPSLPATMSNVMLSHQGPVPAAASRTALTVQRTYDQVVSEKENRLIEQVFSGERQRYAVDMHFLSI